MAIIIPLMWYGRSGRLEIEFVKENHLMNTRSARFAYLLAVMAGLFSPSARAEYGYFYTSSGGSLSGSDIIMKELRWPYWNSYYYNTWINDDWTSSDGVSGYFYNGLALPAAGSPNPVGTQQTFNFSFWPLSNPINITDTIGSVYTSPTTFSMQTIGEGTLFRSPGQWSLWQTNVWYRMAIRTWQPANGAPHQGYAGTWLRDPVAGVWYHMATVQLPFSVTGVTGADSFQENDSGGNLPQRTDYRNCYYHRSGVWNPATEFQVYNHGGGTENTGLIETNTAVYYETCENDPSYTGTITNGGQYSPILVLSGQPAAPPLDPIVVTNCSATVSGSQLLVQWQVPASSSPQFACQINVYTNASYTGTVAAAFFDYAPEARQELLTIPAGITPYPQLTIIDVFNQTNAPVDVAVTNASLLAPASVSGLVNGLAYSYYESANNIYSSDSGTNWSSMPSFAALTPVYNGVANNLDLTPRRRRDGYAFNFNGYLNIASNGLYAFTLDSDAGGILYVDGQPVVNWDGEHSPSSRSGWIGLQTGYHAINVQYFCDTQPTALFSEYFDTLGLSYQGPGVGPVPVPAASLFCTAAGVPAVSLSSPTNGAVVAGVNVPLTASVTANGNTINAVRYYLGNYYLGQGASAPYAINAFLWSSNSNPVRARVFYDGTNIIDSAANLVTTTNLNLSPWQFDQIFYHNTPNGAGIAGGTYSMIGDGMNLLAREVSGNCTLVVHLAGLPGTAAAPDGSTANSGWEAGIILRGNTNMTPGYPWGQSGSAPFTAVFGEVGGGAYYQDETMVNGGGGYSSGSQGSQTWFKLQRTNTTFISSVSSDGVNWTAVWTNSLTDFGSNLYAGFFTYAGPSSNPNLHWASFNNVSLTGNLLGPPGVTVIPSSATAYTSQNLALTAAPSGNPPFSYQWQLNGSNLPGATNAVLNLSNLQFTASGQYEVVLSNANGTATAAAAITVLTPPAPVAAILSNQPAAYWRLNETAGPTAYDTMGSFNGTAEGGLAFGVPGVTNAPFTGFESANLAAQFDGTDSDINVPAMNLNTNAVTILGWFNLDGNQTDWSGVVFCRSGSTTSGVNFAGTTDELGYTWNNSSGTYNWNSGLIAPTNAWTFFALAVSPTNAVMYLATNALLRSATNNVANAVQAFAGTTYLGYDPNSNSRRFNGSMDEVAVYSRTLTGAQVSQILAAAESPAPPLVNLTSPPSGSGFAPQTPINLAASVVANGHAVTSVQFYNSSTLLGQSATPPYNFSWTNAPLGPCTLLAQVTYDGGSTVSSAPAFITVNPIPPAPASITPKALSGNLINIGWPATLFAAGYILYRNGVAIAALAGTNYLDQGLTANTTYAYSVVATNSYGSSTFSVTNSATTPGSGTALWWDPGGSTTGPQDGSGNWGGNAANWWNGSACVAWANGSLAIFGNGATAACSVVLTNNVTPGGLIFNADNGGSYSFSSSGGMLVLSGSPVITCNGSATLSATLNGSGALTVTGPGTLTVTGENTNTGAITVNGGNILVTGGGWYANRGIGSGSLVVSNGAVAEFTQSHGFGESNYGEPVNLNNGTLQLDGDNYASAIALTAGTINVAATHYLAPIGGMTCAVNAGSTASAINTPRLALQGAVTFSVSRGSAPVDLAIGGGDIDGSSGSITKTGAGILQISSTATNYGATSINAGTLQVDGSLGTNTVSVSSGATLAGTGAVNGATAVSSGGMVAPGDAEITGPAMGALTFSNSLTLNSGAKMLLKISKNGGVPTNDLVAVTGRLGFAGSLTVTNAGTNAFAAGDSFLVFNSGSRGGAFSSFSLPALGSNLVWNTAGVTNNGVLSVAALPVITSQPVGLSVNPGGTAAFMAGATGTGPLAYQWRQNGVPVAGATTNVYVVNSATAASAGNYTVVITNNFGSITSLVAVLVMNIPPVIGGVSLSSGGLSLTATGAIGETCILLGASNLAPPVAWLPLQTNTAGTNGLLNFTDLQATNFSERFYELLAQ